MYDYLVFVCFFLYHKAAAPTFVRDEHESMFGVIGQPVTIEFWVYGYPEPEIEWFFGDHKVLFFFHQWNLSLKSNHVNID